eukprot:CAMPEP_0202859470 /NCGR_PEP_ID=MMETSP1391-20130828/1566_1 /ASSEMBLY_ACC=CAM_ASM_000867 /TAXON_ID=1034604 /ORGANISM="Chlamydomonas leiostraca, Strain SAG 11-49" /LENGTH=819 /DNA_ID=CAMNT_0049538503 /DNA_START=158 /DNA_END=2617 /DNA_ORIENTATION=-
MAHMMRAMSSGGHEPSGETVYTNRLAQEQSPYLLQHQHNPVDWYPWGPEAFEKARKEDKPIFLSVGYATCHWCHVMERESFECGETAALLNEHYVAVKVDREERPDVDRVYMSYVQAVSGRGGWPMSVFLTPDLEPMYGGTYYPKADMVQGGELVMPAFTTVLRRLAAMWRTNREEMKAKGTAIMSQLQQALEQDAVAAAAGDGDSDAEGAGARGLSRDECGVVLGQVVEQLARRFDARLGGFGGAPKFPRPAEINALLAAHQWAKVTGAADAVETLHMAVFTLDKMAAGGMYDHLGGGFHRYSVDEYWHVPHFEKMTYDNPQLAATYLDAFLLGGQPRHARVVRGVLDYLRRDMTHAEGGVFSAEDADSFNTEAGHKTEGAFYVWTHKEVMAALGPQRGALFSDAYALKPQGNCTLSPRSDPHHEFGGKNVPIMLQPLAEVAAKHGLTEAQAEETLAGCRHELHALRAQRPRPQLDDKVVAAWNGMVISAYARASRALAAEKPPATPCWPVDGAPPATYLEAALRAARFARQHLWDAGTRRLRRSFCKGPSSVGAFADDYAQMVCGLLDLYEAGGGAEWLAWAAELQGVQDALFWDAAGAGGYFSTDGRDPAIRLRIRDEYDGAEPTASSVSAANLARLAALLPGAGAGAGGSGQPPPGAEYARKAARTLAAFREQLLQAPIVMPQMAVAALLRLRTPLRQVIVAAPKGSGGLHSPAASALLDAVHGAYAPDKAVLLLDLGDDACVQFWRAHNPQALSMAEAHYAAHAGDGPLVFICQDYTCQAPTADPERATRLLAAAGAPAAGAAPRPLDVKLPGM